MTQSMKNITCRQCHWWDDKESDCVAPVPLWVEILMDELHTEDTYPSWKLLEDEDLVRRASECDCFRHNARGSK